MKKIKKKVIDKGLEIGYNGDMKNLVFYQFGSQDSQDIDLLVLVSQLGKIHTNKNRVFEIEEALRSQYEKELNVNLAVLRDGEIKEVFKGTADEVNNSVYSTYQYHSQKFPLKIEKLVSRDVDLKVVRALRIMLSFLSRTKYRSGVKKALKSEVRDQFIQLQGLDLKTINTQEDLGKASILIEDYFKNVAFQMGQTLALIKGKELYTKKDVGEMFSELKPLLQRESNSKDFSQVLEEFKKEFLDSINVDQLKYKKEPLRK